MTPESPIESTPKGSGIARKILFLIVALIVIAALILLALPMARDVGGILIYSIFGIPRQEEPRAEITLEPLTSRLITVNDTFTVAFNVKTSRPINLIAGTLHVPADVVEYDSFDSENSIINLWIRDPSRTERPDEVKFAGGIQRDGGQGGFTGEGRVVAVTVKPVKAGLGYIKVADATVLAHDGKGTEFPVGRPAIAFLVRNPGEASPDLNGDGDVGIGDVGILLFHFAGNAEGRYDLNGDGRTDIADVQLLWSYASQLH
ncbi:MAG: hypothetical protein Q8Q39_05560 [bacterium]|nr:hypothetical protein [bacterium]